MNQDKIDYNKGEVKEAVDDHSFIIKDDSNRDFVVSIYDIRSVDMTQLSRV